MIDLSAVAEVSALHRLLGQEALATLHGVRQQGLRLAGGGGQGPAIRAAGGPAQLSCTTELHN